MRPLPVGEQQSSDKENNLQTKQQRYLESGHNEGGRVNGHRNSKVGHGGCTIKAGGGGENPLALVRTSTAAARAEAGTGVEQTIGAPRSGEEETSAEIRRANALAGGGLLAAV